MVVHLAPGQRLLVVVSLVGRYMPARQPGHDCHRRGERKRQDAEQPAGSAAHGCAAAAEDAGPSS